MKKGIPLSHRTAHTLNRIRDHSTQSASKQPIEKQSNLDTKGVNADLRRDSRFRFHPPPIGDEPD